MNLSGYEAYRLYISIKLHFTSPGFNYFVFGKTTPKIETFNARKDNFFFHKLAKKYNEEKLIGIFVSNFIFNDRIWIGDFLMNVETEEVYTNWIRRTESLEYLFIQDLEYIMNYLEDNNLKFRDMFQVQANTHPLILKFLLQKKIIPETYTIINYLMKFEDVLNDKLKDDILWKKMYGRYAKYAMFLDLDSRKNKLQKILVDAIKNRKLV